MTGPDPKPPPRIVNSGAGLAKVLYEGACRICERRDFTSDYPLTRHHLVKRSQGGDDVDANIVPLCGHGTIGCHGKVEAYQGNARQLLRHALKPEEVLYVVSKKSREWINTHYPK